MKLLVSALEPSSNAHLKSLVPFLEGRAELLGVFDPQFGKPLYKPSEFSVMGFSDVVRNVGFFWNARREMIRLASEADKVLLMDSSSFNIPLAQAIKKRYPKKEIIYYILPQVWAWKPWRAKIIEESCDFLAGILPFEIECYKHKAHYVGHPLLDVLPPARTALPDTEAVAFMPGSRLGEIGRIFPIFREVAREIKGRKILIIPPFYKGQDLGGIYGDVSDFELSFQAHSSLQEASFAFICSGTATLEAALMGVPLVLAYKTRALDYLIAKYLVNVRYVGLANIFETRRGESPLHEELLQNELSAENLLRAYKECDRGRFLERSLALRNYLKDGSSRRVAKEILK